jgi:cytochrome c-type biogenesis protein CcmF
MISGILALSIAFVATTVATAAYWLFYRDADERYLNLANRSFAIGSIGIIFAVILLYYNIFAHNFQLNYVYSYTSLQLSSSYLISTFWAGQEGTFLLWLLFGTIYSLVLIRTMARREPLVMFFVMLVQSFLLLILLKKSPFAMIWHVHSEAPLGFTPANGASLNPLLQNPWMIIHPPVMFVGYSSTVVAFAMAMNAMVKKKFSDWVVQARPWVIFSTLFLAAGIIMGAYWSYVTLGWGGYWAWDPVENASLVPWLFMTVLLHGLLIQIRQKGLVKTNLFLAGLAFISVLWGSFLTRSGVLSDFSVHSFAESDLNLYLITFVALFAGIFLYFYFKSLKLIDSPKFAEGIFSRETFILLGMMSLLFTGLAVFVATSSPIYTGLLAEPSNVSIGFYNAISVPVAVFILLSMAFAPLLIWKVSEMRDKRTLFLGIAAALLFTILGVIFGLDKPVSIILIFLSVFAIFINGYVGVKFLRKLPSKSGAYLSHVGVGLMIIGIITSSMYSESEKIILPAGEFQNSQFGYDLQFVKFEERADGKDRVKLIVKKENGSYQADPQFYFSEYTKSYMLSPHVKVGLQKDIYISPISFQPGETARYKQLELTKNQTETLGDLKITFNRFVVGDHLDQSPMAVKADLTVMVSRESHSKEFNLQPALWMENGKLQGNDLDIPETNYQLSIESLDATEGRIVLAIHDGAPAENSLRDLLAVEVSEKPLISILWFGCIILITGITVSLVDRIKGR